MALQGFASVFQTEQVASRTPKSTGSTVENTFLEVQREIFRVMTEFNDPDSDMTIFKKTYTKEQKNGAAAAAAINLYVSQLEAQSTMSLQIFNMENKILEKLTGATG